MFFVMRVFASSPQRIRNKQHALGVCVFFLRMPCGACAKNRDFVEQCKFESVFSPIEC